MRLRLTLFCTALVLACTREPDKGPAPASPEPAPVAEPTEPETAAVITFSAPVPSPAAEQAHLYAQMRLLGRSLEPHSEVHFTPVEDSRGQALQRFHDALGKLEAGGEPDAKVRVAVYGSSSVAADRYTGYLRGYLQHRFGDGGVGFVSLVPLWRWHRHNEVNASATSGWTIEHAQKERTGRLDGHYGLLGASAHTASKRAHALVRASTPRGAMTDVTASDIVELYHLAQPGGGRYRVEIGRKQVGEVSTQADTHAAAYFRPAWKGPAMPVRVKPVGDGEVRLFGAVFEREGPGVVVDELGIGGTRATNMVGWTEEIWADNLRRRAPALYILAYGANEAGDDEQEHPIARYRQDLGAVLDRFERVLPEASCVLVGPQDFPMRAPDDQESWQRRPRMDAVVQAQREIAKNHGCGFFDTRELMGGPDHMMAWVAAQPPLAKADHLHFTTLGYTHMGRVLADALLAGYDATHAQP
jgi:lysophospholipase L1-like esterase